MEGDGEVGPYSVGVKGLFFANERAKGSLEWWRFVVVVAGGGKGGGEATVPPKKREMAVANSRWWNNGLRVVSGVVVRLGPGQGGAAMGRSSVTWGVGVVVIWFLTTNYTA